MPLGLLFLAIGFWRNWTTAYLVLIGSEAPGDAHAGASAVLLSLGGYMIIPLVIGTGVAGFFQYSVDKQARADPKRGAVKALPVPEASLNDAANNQETAASSKTDGIADAQNPAAQGTNTP